MAEPVAHLTDRDGAAEPDDDDVPVLAPGAEIAPGYQVVEHLRRGDALDVYTVFSTERLCSCVAKTIRPDRAHEERVRKRLAQEGYLLQTLAHPLLLRGLATFTEPELVVIVETVPGPTLEQIIEDRARRLPAADLCHLGSHITAATHFLHGSGYLHLDIRPSNIVGHGGIAKLIDLGLARPPGPVPRGYGSHLYLSPEQATGSHVTEAADVWGIGATLYEAAAGISPFDAHDAADAEVLERNGYLQLRRPAPPLRRLGRRLPAGLTAVIGACLHEDPQRRPTTHALWEALQEVLTGLEPAEPAPVLAPVASAHAG
jgi:serine/threonine protein kinase